MVVRHRWISVSDLPLSKYARLMALQACERRNGGSCVSWHEVRGEVVLLFEILRHGSSGLKK